jgi:hypothetical protein
MENYDCRDDIARANHFSPRRIRVDGLRAGMLSILAWFAGQLQAVSPILLFRSPGCCWPEFRNSRDNYWRAGLIRSRWALLAVLMPLALTLTNCSSGNSTAPNPTPAIATIFPDAITAGSEMFNIDITGQGFIQMPVSVALWNGSPRTTTFNAATGHLVVTINASDITNAGIALVTVMNPSPGGGTSSGATFTVKPLQNGAPTNISVDPTSTNAGTKGPFKLTVNGLNFVVPDPVTCSNGAVIRFNGTFRQPTTCSPTSLTTELTTTDLQSAGFAAVWVDNPLPGGIVASSTAVDFTINGTKPATASGPRVVSVNALGGPANGRSSAPAMSADGRFVAFSSTATNLVSFPNRGNVFIRDTCLDADHCTPTTYPVDLAADGSAPNGMSLGPLSISAGGRFVGFASFATNLSDGNSRTLAVSLPRVFIRDTCLGANAPQSCRPLTTMIPGLAGTDEMAASYGSPSLSADGRFVVFLSKRVVDATTKEQAGNAILVSDTCVGATISCTPFTVAIAAGDDGAASRSRFRPQISGEGRYIVFDSSDAESSDPLLANSGSVFLADSCFGAANGCVPRTMRVSDSGSASFRISGAQSASVSSGGRFVVFRADKISMSDAAPPQRGAIFLRDSCIGASVGNCIPTTTLVSSDTTAVENAESFSPHITADGRFVSFTTMLRGVPQGFVRDSCFGATAACSPQILEIASPMSVVPADGVHSPEISMIPLSAGGKFAAFFSLKCDNLVAPISGSGDVFLTSIPLR